MKSKKFSIVVIDPLYWIFRGMKDIAEFVISALDLSLNQHAKRSIVQHHHSNVENSLRLT